MSGSYGPDLGIPGIDSVTEIGRSAAATTYRVRDTASGRMVVVKLLTVTGLAGIAADRFDREQRAIEGLSEHPNLVSVFGHGFTGGGQPYVVTEEISGGSIAARLKRGVPMQGPDIIELGVRMAGALESAHRAGIVHGDLRAEDVMLTGIGEPMLADFGVVTVTGATPDRTDDPRRLAHIAPEVLEARGVSTSSDLYSLASILYSLLAGEDAFVGPADYSVIPVIKRIASNPPPDLRQKNVPDPVADAIEKAMAKEARQRPESARDFGRLLQQAQVALGLPMTEMTVLSPAGFPPRPAVPSFAPVQPVQPLAGPPGSPPGSSGPSGPGGPPSTASGGKSSTPLIAGAAAVVVLLIAGGLFFALRGGDDDPGGDTTTTAETIPALELTTVDDDTGVITVEVPDDWSDLDGRPFDNDIANLRSARDLDDFLDTYEGAGIDITAFASDDANALFDPASEPELEAFLDQSAEFEGNRSETVSAACDDPERDDFNEGDLNGFIDVYTDCGPDNTDLILIAAATEDESAGVVVLSILVDDDERAARDDILASFEIDLLA